MSWTVDSLAYDNRKKLTVDQTDIDADLTDFPVTVFITADADIGDTANADGFDIRFTTSDGSTLCKYERESWAVAGGQATAVFHVKVPAVSGSADTDFYIYYRAADTADGADPTNVWDANYVGVWHLGEGDSTAANFYQDSTSSNKDGTLVDVDGDTTQAVGKVGNCLDFNGDADSVNTNLIPFTGDQAFALEAWISLDTVGSTPCIVSWGGSGTLNLASLYVSKSGSGAFSLEFGGGNGYRSALGVIATGIWYQVVGVKTGAGAINTTCKLYINGSEVSADVASTNTPNIAGTNGLKIAAYPTAGADFSNGKIDEVRVSNIARSAAWIRASYESQNDTMLTYGAEELATVHAYSYRIFLKLCEMAFPTMASAYPKPSGTRREP